MPVEWGNGVSRRLLVKADALGYTLTDTIVRAGTRSLLQYRSHLEACYCISGAGWVSDSAGCAFRIEPGTLYALDQHDPHALEADAEGDMRLVCVFAPALEGHEVHDLRPDGYSAYGEAAAVA
jgi:L-ectoine synthase